MNFMLARLVLWFVTLALFPVPVNLWPRSFKVEVLQAITLDALPQERQLGHDRQLTERVLVYLEQLEKKEIDPWLRDDLRIAWITTKWAQSGVPEWSWHRDSSAHVAATYQVLHCHPDEVWPRIVARRQAMLGAEYEKFFGEDSSLRKPVRSVTLRDSKQRRNAAAA